VGWSEGAGLDLVAAADELNHDIFSGVIAIGTPETNILAWRWWDAGAWVTKRVPREPTFSSAQFIPKVSPLPLFLIASTSNEYVTPEETRALFSAAREPKQLVVIDAKDHKYRGNTERFLTVLRQALDWIEAVSQTSSPPGYLLWQAQRFKDILDYSVAALSVKLEGLNRACAGSRVEVPSQRSARAM
jgi:fermentation-respiration switch protein FrsA (DUF1100 family)